MDPVRPSKSSFRACYGVLEAAICWYTAARWFGEWVCHCESFLLSLT